MNEGIKGSRDRGIEKSGLAGLVGVPYAEANCWEVVVMALALMGISMPADHGEAAARAEELVDVVPMGERLVAGDIVQIRPFSAAVGTAEGTHVGVVVGDGSKFLHAMRGVGSRLDSVSVWRQRIERVMRPRKKAEGGSRKAEVG